MTAKVKDAKKQQARLAMLERRKEAVSRLANIPKDELMTPTELATLLGVSRPVIYKWTRQGVFVRHGFKHLGFYLRTEVLEALNSISPRSPMAM